MNDALEGIAARLATASEGDLARLVAEGLASDRTAFRERLTARAVEVRREVYANTVYVRGLVEISSYCRNNCLYCGIRAGNATASRYRLTDRDILACADEGYALGFRTIVLQGGEDLRFSDARLVGIIRAIKAAHPDVAVTLSLGERGYASFRALREAGADRYLLRHETADAAHYGRLHPSGMSFANRMASLRLLRDLGYQVGCGFMVGSPGQTPETLAKDLAFIRAFQPEMCGIGPFVPHHATPFAHCPRGSVEATCFLLSIIRILCPRVLLPATTALGTIDPRGREKGILSGANVVMPNLSPLSVRRKYELYDNKLFTGAESAQSLAALDRLVQSIGYRVVISRGDAR